MHGRVYCRLFFFVCPHAVWQPICSQHQIGAGFYLEGGVGGVAAPGARPRVGARLEALHCCC